MKTFRIGLTVGAEREFTRMVIGDAEFAIDPVICVPGTEYVLEADIETMRGVITEGSVVMPRDGDGRPRWEVDGLPVVRPTEQLAKLLAGEPVYVPPRAD